MSPDFRFACPICGQHISAPTATIGSSGVCPNCSATFAISAPGSSETSTKTAEAQTGALPSPLPQAHVPVKKRDYRKALPGASPTPVPTDTSERVSRVREAWRASEGFVSRYLTPKTVLCFTVILLLASWTYPPGVHYSPNYLHGWFFLFDMTGKMRVDFGRLILLDAIIAALGGMLAWACSRDGAPRLAAAVILIVIPVGAIGVLATREIQQHRQAAWTQKYYAELNRRSAEQAAEFERSRAALDAAQQTARKAAEVSLVATLKKTMPNSASAIDILEAIKEARRLGFSDNDIYSHLNKGSDAYRAAYKDGYSAREVENALAKSAQELENVLAESASRIKPDDLKRVVLFDVQI